MYFQHNKKTRITKSSFKYLFFYKKELLKNITKLMDDLGIEFVIAHGNLIEHKRKMLIYHDDDLDIRYNINRMREWYMFCKKNNRKLEKYNLVFDPRFHYIDKQKYNGIQCNLIRFSNPYKIKEYPEMDIHCDVVPSYAEVFLDNRLWPPYNIDFSKRLKIKYLGITTYQPSEIDTEKVLRRQYGRNYIIPILPYLREIYFSKDNQ